MASSNTNEQLKTRIKKLNSASVLGECVIYVMSRDQRVQDNHALLAAQKHAAAKELPLAVVFNLMPQAGNRSREHYQWMLVGLREVEAQLSKLNVPLITLIGNPSERLTGCITHLKPDAVYFDFSPLRGSRALQKHVAANANCSVYVVDTHNVIPVWVTSDKQEYAARTIRSKIHRALTDYLDEPESILKHEVDWPGTVMSLGELSDKIEKIVQNIASNHQKSLQKNYAPGVKAANAALGKFIDERLKNYSDMRNDPSKDGLSGLSPYLHFGQLSSLRVVVEVQKAVAADSALQKSADVLIEEMVVRKELSDNYCYYNQDYAGLNGAPDWAIKTLAKHADDPREHLYTLEQFECAETHDSAWNAAQLEMVRTGKMHGYMRMYWAKKVLEWSETPDRALQTLLYLNDFYSIDGGDPNGYVGIMWSIAGVHDRPWGERPIYGTIRCMVYGGLKRKFDIDVYIDMYS